METSNTIPTVDISGDDIVDVPRPVNIRRKPRARMKETVEIEIAGNADDETPMEKETKWSKYSKRYKPQWETLEVFENWLHRTPDDLIMMGKPEAFCLYCQQCLRAHKSDLLAHAKSKKHKDAENKRSANPKDCRSFIESYVPDFDDDARNEPTFEAKKESTSPRPKASRRSKQIENKQAIIEQIEGEREETDVKIKLCEEELNNLRIKRARLEFELEYYNNN